MKILRIHQFQLIAGPLPDQMPSVTCGIDEDVVRFFLQAPLDHCLQIFIFHLKFFKGQVVHIKDKFIIPVFDLGDHLIQILKLMLVHFDNAKAVLIIAV
ncbi:hypothetical protein EVA_14111 [gut metagenome]|uniref:Uncharacterized protein n=1 Tax=gut metagenome TaxID=749906 RepID=J9FS53_9ZZZZ